VSTTTNVPSPQTPKTSGLAIASLICGLVGPCTAGLASIAGLILGIVSLKKIKAGGGAVGGRGLAIAGIIVSVVTLILCLILAVLVGGAWLFVPKMVKSGAEKVKTVDVLTNIANIDMALSAFELDCGRYPTTEEGIKALLVQPGGVTEWHGPYLKRGVPKDPWGNPYNYRFPGQHNPTGFDLYSFGPDGQEGGGDDIDNWSRR